QGGACVEVAALLDERLTLVRDSKNPDGAVLSFTGPAWASFTQDLKTGRYDPVRN
ncbi:MAG: hypothetical protein JWN52_2090, partial [Actinomycetia bacterium]|nr:hypothetical protein [Actinomycetes bacterium]